MNITRFPSSVALAGMALLAGCAGQQQNYVLETSPSFATPPQTVTVPQGTLTGGASTGQATALAQEIADGNNNAMKQFGALGGQMNQLQGTEKQALANSQAALAKLDQLSMQQGTGSITLFFNEGSTTLNQFQFQRLVNFLDYLQRDSRGRKVILVSIGSASSVGAAAVNQRLSLERSEAPLPVINQYLVNTPHQFFKVTGIGDMYAPKHATASVDARYQNVRIIAAYDTAQLAGVPGAKP
jgi:outer membrane protein OmpA-like peptidoglycan-associated protein